jgi:ATP-binding cassette subfamily F protein 2
MNALGAGEIELPKQLDYYHLRQEVEASETITALQMVLKADRERELLEKEMEELALEGDADEAVAARLDFIYSRLDELDADTAETRAARILYGLGFSTERMHWPTSSFSGGWRMRIALAQALFTNPTLLLLDEPTNHLDIEAVVWLESYLKRFNKILLMVSHSQDFMNEVCTKIIDMRLTRLIYYEGNYDQYCMTRSDLEAHQMKRHGWEQKQIAGMKDYIARFGHGSAKLARQAQSKEKVLAKMTRGGLTAAVIRDANINFKFPCAGDLPPPMLQFDDVAFGYPGREVLFRGLNLGINMDSRICLVGPNGAGKTTLTKLMCRELEPTEGYVAKNAHCTIARFHQHFVDQIDMTLTPLQWMMAEYPEIISPEPFRSQLGRMGVSGTLQMSPFGTLSDGQMSRCVLAWMAFKQPHFLILDEPTNHLDIESIDALAQGINDFEGAVVVVSHDLRLIAQIADEIWIADKGKVERFNGDIADYKELVSKQITAAAEAEFSGKRKKSN